MGAEPQRLHVAFFPLMAAGHMTPVLDMAKLFATHHVKTTIITTPFNAPTFLKPLKRYKNCGPPIDIEVIPFPSTEAGLPDGVENFEHFTSVEMTYKFLKAVEWLREPLEQVMEKRKPNCLVADMFLPFATDVAAKFNIPRLVFHGSGCFAFCLMDSFMKYEPHKTVSTDDEEFLLPQLPHQIKLTRMQIDEDTRLNKQSEMMELMGRAIEAENKSYGVIVNSFYELEPDYADYYRNVMGKRSWLIGPVSLCNSAKEAKFNRGKDSSIDANECLKWLNSKKSNSVVYISFGSLAEVSVSQLREIALGLEASGQDFIWVVRRNKNQEENEDWLPEGFEIRMEGKGLIIRGWAPQVLILDHEAVGAFMTHCGWNSILEGISCGVPMLTWPVFAEQFHNEKLVTEILKIGTAVGAKMNCRTVEASVKCEDIAKATQNILISEEALEKRSRVEKLKEMARKAVNKGGSSYSDMCSLTGELKNYKS